MEKRNGESVQVQREIAYRPSREGGSTQGSWSIRGSVQNVNTAVLGLVAISAWLCLTMKCSEAIVMEALPAYLIVCCLLFFKATEQKS